MTESVMHFALIQHGTETLVITISFYLSVLLLINAETIIAAAKNAARSHTLI